MIDDYYGVVKTLYVFFFFFFVDIDKKNGAE